jgi:tryptophan 2,3-dioxygenase
MELKPEIIDRIKKLDEKFQAMGQDLTSYLDGLLYSDYLTYWDYIHLDTLLTLQTPKTKFPDENIFIIYHQVTELLFKLSLHEFDQLGAQQELKTDYFVSRVRRINMYFQTLIKSFDIMVDGMEPEQFLKFRMSLLPASGFQSAQYRKIEICATTFNNLLVQESKQHTGEITPGFIQQNFDKIYWKMGATELKTGKKTLTLRQFEEKYSDELINLASDKIHTNLLVLFRGMDTSDPKHKDLVRELKELDIHVNINWPLSHYKSAVRYLQKDPEDIAATGGTNWQKYLPPRFQRRIFYPELWNEQELGEWGKAWVKTNVFGVQ